MGSLLSTKLNTYEDEYKGVYRVKGKETAAMKKVWLTVENDLSYYGSIFSTILFRNHPQYVKYFHEDNIPEFVQDARIKQKFSAVCTIVSALFVDYSKKRHQRDHLLGYIAMIHKDMNLTPKDLENFMMDLLEMLIQEQPNEMTAECTVVHMRYFSGLLNRIGYFMEIQRENDLFRFEEESSKSACSWLTLCDPPLIYGRSLDYWITKKHYWQVRMAVWSSLDMELSAMSSFLTTKGIDTKPDHSEAIKHGSGKRPSSIIAKHRQNPWLKLTRHIRSSANTSSEKNSLHNRTTVWYERCKRDKRRQSKNLSSLTSSRLMEPISEVPSQQIIPTLLMSSIKNAWNFPDVAKPLKKTKVNNISDTSPSNPQIKRNATIDTPRERKRRINRKGSIYPYKKGNAIHPNSVLFDENNIEDT